MTNRAGNPTLLALQEKIREEMNEIADHVDGGGCKDFAAYMHDTGAIEGLAIAERELLVLDKQIEEG
jgi:hypothetical protein